MEEGQTKCCFSSADSFNVALIYQAFPFPPGICAPPCKNFLHCTTFIWKSLNEAFIIFKLQIHLLFFFFSMEESAREWFTHGVMQIDLCAFALHFQIEQSVCEKLIHLIWDNVLINKRIGLQPSGVWRNFIVLKLHILEITSENGFCLLEMMPNKYMMNLGRGLWLCVGKGYELHFSLQPIKCEDKF